MRTTTSTFFRGFTLLTIMASLMVGCGKDNKSGGGSSNPYGNFNTVAGSSASNVLSRLGQEYPCTTSQYSGGGSSQQRIRTTVSNLQNSMVHNSGSYYVGVTTEGDIAIVSGQNGYATMEVYACVRPGMNNSAQAYVQQLPYVNTSVNCTLGEITKSDVFLQTQNGTYTLKFFQIGVSRPSQYCSNNQYY